MRSGRLIVVAVLAAALAACCYGVGVMSGFYILDPDQMCAASNGITYYEQPSGADEWLGIRKAAFPISRVCEWGDGMRKELVPQWVNPALIVFLAIAVAAITAVLVRLVGRIWQGPRNPKAPATGGTA